MLDKLKNIFTNKEKRMENLISFLIILVITLIVINKIINEEESEVDDQDYENMVGVELAQIENDNQNKYELESRLEEILSKISGVGEVSVLITYSESSSLVPIYNVNSSTSKIEETDSDGGTRVTETENNQKDVITDSSSNVITEKTVMPAIEGAIIIAEGASDSNIKSNIISAVEAVTGVASHKIQVFEMGEN
jgi:stage III sporulation protein AG